MRKSFDGLEGAGIEGTERRNRGAVARSFPRSPSPRREGTLQRERPSVGRLPHGGTKNCSSIYNELDRYMCDARPRALIPDIARASEAARQSAAERDTPNKAQLISMSRVLFNSPSAESDTNVMRRDGCARIGRINSGRK
jgi:hypothetical protein